MLNSVCLVGRLTKDIDLRATQGRASVASFTLAVTRNFKNKNGEYDADFIRCIAWNKTAETLDQYCRKGDLISVTGEIQTSSYEDRETGKRVYRTEVNVRQLSLFPKKMSGQPRQQSPQEALTQAQPAPQPQQNTVDVTPDDLPF